MNDFFAGPEIEPKEPAHLEPTNDTEPREFLEKEVDYRMASLRGPLDVVLSGPITGGWGPGRYFQNFRLAREFLEAKYGKERVKRVPGRSAGRWAFLIKNLRSE